MFSETFSASLVEALQDQGISEPTVVQAKVIPMALAGQDLLVESKTGTGKTLAYVLPVLKELLDQQLSSSGLQTLILVPTRELALQVSEVISLLLERLSSSLRLVTVIGGHSVELQSERLSEGASLVVATPGRLLDFMDSGNITLSHVKTLVLDEADKLLTLGFQDDILWILERLPLDRQSLMFSATVPPKVRSLVRHICEDPIPLCFVDEVKTVASVAQRVLEVHRDDRRALLKHLLDTEGWKQVIVFVASKKAARNTAAKLARDGYGAKALHGDLYQDERSRLLKAFQLNKFKVMIATDIAARGIDLEDLSCVVNYDLPRSPMDYIHRIGRSGRAGKQGVAISFIDYEDREHFKLIEKRAGLRLERESIAGFPLKGEPPKKQKGKAPVKGKRKSKKDKLREQKALEDQPQL